MTIKTTIGSNGVTETNNASGCVIDFSTSNSGFLPWGPASASYILSNVTMSSGMAGLNIISGTAGITASLPNPATCVGTMFVFCGVSAQFHIVTASTAAGLIDDGENGVSKISIYQGSVGIFCDGLRYNLMFASSGSVAS